MPGPIGNGEIPQIITFFSVENIKRICEIGFWAIIATIAILTYRRAKKTILQPIKTETYKLQLRAFEDVFNMFVGKGEVELREQFGLKEVFRCNVFKLFDDYAELFFDKEINKDNRPYSSSACPISIASEEELELCTDYVVRERGGRVVPDPRAKAAIWAGYKYSPIRLPFKYNEMEEKLGRIISSPLMPSHISALLIEFRKLLFSNLLLLKEVLTSAAKEFPEKYPNEEELKKASLVWVSYRYNKKFTELEGKSREIIESVKNYLRIEEITKI